MSEKISPEKRFHRKDFPEKDRTPAERDSSGILLEIKLKARSGC